jgi:hypothetical protein
VTGFASMTPVKNGPGVWYLVDISYCPVCGRSEENRTRMAPPAPPKGGSASPAWPNQRYRYTEQYDYCNHG